MRIFLPVLSLILVAFPVAAPAGAGPPVEIPGRLLVSGFSATADVAYFMEGTSDNIAPAATIFTLGDIAPNRRVISVSMVRSSNHRRCSRVAAVTSPWAYNAISARHSDRASRSTLESFLMGVGLLSVCHLNSQTVESYALPIPQLLSTHFMIRYPAVDFC